MKTTDPHKNSPADFADNLRKLTPPEIPSGRLRARFQTLLAEESQRAAEGNSPPRVISFRRPWWQTLGLAAAMLAVGLFVGARFFPKEPTAELAELAALRERMDKMDRLLAYAVLQEKTSGERFAQVLDVAREKNPDRHQLADLVAMLAFDPSPNVRLSVVDALRVHAGDPLVSGGVLSVLPKESAPEVQAAMIDLLAGSRDPAAKPFLAQLGAQEHTDAYVREAALHALAVLETTTYDPPLKSILL